MLSNLRDEFTELYENCSEEERNGAKMFWLENESKLHSALYNIHNDIIYDDVPSLDDIKEAIDVLTEMNNPNGTTPIIFYDGSLHDELLGNLNFLQAFLTCVHGINRYINGSAEMMANHKHKYCYTHETVYGTLKRVVNQPDKGYKAITDYCNSGYVVDEDILLPYIHEDYDYYTQLDELRKLIDTTQPHDYIPTSMSDLCIC